jgi:hypothetical protein
MKKRLIELNPSIPEEKMMFWKLRTWLTFINIAPALTCLWENWFNLAWSLGVERKHVVSAVTFSNRFCPQKEQHFAR